MYSLTRRHIIRAVFAVGVAAFMVGTHAAFAHPTVDVVASNWKFTPDKISIPAGEPTTLRLTSSEGVHGIASDELGIKLTTIMPGKFVEVTFTPQKAGTYPVHCAIICGAGHDNMVLTVEVK